MYHIKLALKFESCANLVSNEFYLSYLAIEPMVIGYYFPKKINIYFINNSQFTLKITMFQKQACAKPNTIQSVFRSLSLIVSPLFHTLFVLRALMRKQHRGTG